MLLVAKGIATRSKDATNGAPGLTHRNKKATMFLRMLESRGTQHEPSTIIHTWEPPTSGFRSSSATIGTTGRSQFWPPLSHILINFYMWHSWCYIEDWLLKPGLTAQV